MVEPGTALLAGQIEDGPARSEQQRMKRDGKKLRPEIEIRSRLFIGRREFELDGVAVPMLDPDLGFRKPRQRIGRTAIEREFVGKSPQGDRNGQRDEAERKGPEQQIPTQAAKPGTMLMGTGFCSRRRNPGRA